MKMVVLRRLSLIGGLLTAPASAAAAQGSFEAAAGWNLVSPGPTADTYRYKPAPYLRGSLVDSVESFVRFRLDGDLLFFRLRSVHVQLCPFPDCPSRSFDTRVRGTAAVAGNVLLVAGPKQIMYVLGGIGVYDTETQTNSLHVGASAGVGVTLRTGSHYRADIEATWHALAPRGSGPGWFLPIGVGLRI